jgi:dihydrofolate reductase
MKRPLMIVAAIADNGVIGRDNRLLWRIKTDLRRYRELTWGKPMIMGRKTFESLGKPLPGRETIVLTRDPSFAADGVHVVRSWEEALRAGDELADRMGAGAIVVAGGSDIYALALPEAQILRLTEVHAAPEGDAVFPAFDRGAFRELRRTDHPKGPDDEHPFTFVDLERRSTAERR